MNQKNTLTIAKPDDWHLHLREGSALKTTVPHSASQFKRAIIMPNTKVPITTTELALQYKKIILEHAEIAGYNDFLPLMTLYLTDQTTPDVIKTAADSGEILACKLYPQGATTNSNSGVSDIKKIYPTLETMQKHDIALLIHGEVTNENIDIFDREKVFIDKILQDIRTEFPELKITLEHLTTKHGVDFILNNSRNTAATLTPHHLLLNRNDLLVGGIKPHYYCLPILKDSENQKALIQAALSGDKRFFAGSDSAPHAKNQKESSCGCAGVYYGPHTVAIYTEFFARHHSLDKLEAFLSHYGADYYGLERNTETIQLSNHTNHIPDEYEYQNGTIVPFWFGQEINWQIGI